MLNTQLDFDSSWKLPPPFFGGGSTFCSILSWGTIYPRWFGDFFLLFTLLTSSSGAESIRGGGRVSSFDSTIRRDDFIWGWLGDLFGRFLFISPLFPGAPSHHFWCRRNGEVRWSFCSILSIWGRLYPGGLETFQFYSSSYGASTTSDGRVLPSFSILVMGDISGVDWGHLGADFFHFISFHFTFTSLHFTSTLTFAGDDFLFFFGRGRTFVGVFFSFQLLNCLVPWKRTKFRKHRG